MAKASANSYISEWGKVCLLPDDESRMDMAALQEAFNHWYDASGRSFKAGSRCMTQREFAYAFTSTWPELPRGRTKHGQYWRVRLAA